MSESDSVEKYCVEAKQWQAALQESRRLRGDAGPLSKFSIELLDDGYRAVDPAMKIRFVVRPAPADTPLTAEGDVARPGNGQASVPPRTSVRPPAQSTAPAAFPATPSPSVKPAAAPDVATETGGPPRPGPKKAAASVRPARANVVVPADAVPPAPKVPQGLFPTAAGVADQPAPAAVATPLGPVSLEIPESRVLRQRAEEPRNESPITYREIAYSVKPGVSRNAVEAVLWARFREVSEALADRSNGRFIQLAVFDHVFEQKPLRAPLGTLAWKDWRGSPVLNFPGFDRTSKAPPSSMPPAKAPSMPPAGAPILLETRKPVSKPPEDSELEWQSPPAAAAIVEAPAPAPAPAPKPEIVPPAPTPVEQPAPAAAAAPAAALPKVQTPAAEKRISSKPPKGAARRRPGEDLISELFETSHELHFMFDVRAGAQFVLDLLSGVLPSEGILIHAFDINTQHFVVVRAHGPHPDRALLSRTPDKDPLCNEIMRRGTSLVVPDAKTDERFAAARWESLGIRPSRALCSAVKQGGRYLGMIELGNPIGEAPVHETEINALDYISEQFAEFLANRPIVLDADVILGKS